MRGQCGNGLKSRHARSTGPYTCLSDRVPVPLTRGAAARAGGRALSVLRCACACAVPRFWVNALTDHCGVERNGKLYYFGGLEKAEITARGEAAPTRPSDALYMLDTTGTDGWAWSEVVAKGVAPTARYDHSMVSTDGWSVILSHVVYCSGKCLDPLSNQCGFYPRCNLVFHNEPRGGHPIVNETCLAGT